MAAPKSKRATENDGSARRTAGANSSRKVLQLLLAFSERRPEASVAELAEIVGAPVATSYRYVALLKELQLLEEGNAGRYHLTSQVMPLARAAQLANDLAKLARPAMEEAAAKLRETVMLVQHFGDAAVCADRVECDRAMRFTFQPGHSLPLGIGASGKMLLSCLPEAERNRRITQLRKRGLREELDEIAGNGYATSDGEIDDGVWACSVPIQAAGQRATVLSVAGPAARIDGAAREAAITAMRGYAGRIQQAIASYAL